MLTKLTIDQFVIIDHLELDFLKGLTILTGETGAGKSILLDATGLVLGEKSDPDSIRSGSDQSVIEAIFSPPKNNGVWKFLQDKKLVTPEQDNFKVVRTVRRHADEEILFNGRPIEQALLKRIGIFLIEIHGQFANQNMLDPQNQLTLLDLSGGFPPEVFKNVKDALDEVNRYKRELAEEDAYLTKHRHELRKIEEVVRRFDKLGMENGFVEAVEAEHARLLTAKETSETFQAILSQLIAANGVVMGLSSANNLLTRNKNLDPEVMVDLTDLLAASLENARAAAKEMRRIAPMYDIDTRPLDKLTEVLQELKAIGREMKIEFHDLDAYYQEISTKLKRLKNGRETIARLEESLQRAKKSYLHHSRILHEKRVVAGKELSEVITRELPPLKLMRAEFSVIVEEKVNMEWTERGLDEVIFTARMNPGMPFSPVSETASGGELARLVLAIKVVLQKVQVIPTLIFDEVDTGIGGAAAAAVGERLARLAEDTQVLVITHSPQVASRSDQHLHVSKSTDGISTTSTVRRLQMKERIDEISRMLSGDTITPEANAAAMSLIEESRKAAERRANRPPDMPPPPPPAAPVETAGTV